MNSNNNSTTTTTTITTSDESSYNYEYSELQAAREKGIYSLCAGLHQIEDALRPHMDPHGNPLEADLAVDGSFKDYTVVIGNFLSRASITLHHFESALEQKGFQVVMTFTEGQFVSALMSEGAHCAVLLSTSTQQYNYECWTDCSPDVFAEMVESFHRSGRGLWFLTDDEPLTEHANAVLEPLFGINMKGDTPGNNNMTLAPWGGGGPSDQPGPGQFKRHIITTGIKSLYEGQTISYPHRVRETNYSKAHPTHPYAPFKVLACSSDGNPVSLYADHQFLEPERGRVMIDGGYTKLYHRWDEAGTARYCINAVVWLLGLERSSAPSTAPVPVPVRPTPPTHPPLANTTDPSVAPTSSVPVLRSRDPTTSTAAPSKVGPRPIVIAIDFGSSYTGFAYKLANRPLPYVFASWPGAPVQYCKTLSKLLYAPVDDDRYFISIEPAPAPPAHVHAPVPVPPRRLERYWGHDVDQEIANREDAEGLELYGCFKMGIHVATNPSGLVRDLSGLHVRPAFDVIVDYLSLVMAFVKDHLKEMLRQSYSPVDISWCLTIPAIWTEREKVIMKKAAYCAGMTEEECPTEGEAFRLVLEPEAAAVHCITFAKQQDQPLIDGETFLLVDAGGGTVDLTSYTYRKGPSLRELTPGSGGPCGSSQIDKAFIEYLTTHLPPGRMDEVINKRKSGFLELMNNWEELKCNFNISTSRSEVVYLKVPPSLSSLLTMPNYNTVTGRLSIERQKWNALFQPTVQQIVALIAEQFEKVHSIGSSFRFLFLVGGLGQSNLLRKAIEERFPEVKLICPLRAGEAVLEGAISLASSPSVIQSRRARVSLGVKAIKPFEAPWNEDQTKLKIFPNREDKWAIDCLDLFVKAGEEIETTQEIFRSFKPTHEYQTEMVLELYQSPKSSSRYVTNPECLKVGFLVIDIRETLHLGLNRTVHLYLMLGESDIKIRAIEQETGKEYMASLYFNGKIWNMDKKDRSE